MGRQARRWVTEECNWDIVAERYVSFLQAVAEGREWRQPAKHPPEIAVAPSEPAPLVEPDYILGWAPEGGGHDYVDTHITRLAKTLAITPPGGPNARILEMGSYFQITPSLKTKLGYGEVRACYYGPAGEGEKKAG